MLTVAAILVAGAVAFCAGQPDEPRCADAPVAAVEITDAHRATIAELGAESHLPRAMFVSDAGERWRVRGPRQRGDCEDRLLWAAAELRRLHPELANAYRFVAVIDPIEGGRSNGRRVLHLILVIEGVGERVVIDTQHRNPRPWSAYASRQAWSAVEGLGRSWAPYR